MFPLWLIVGGGVLLALFSRSRVNPVAPLGVVTLYEGVPYRIVTRLETGSGTESVIAAIQQTVRTALSAAGHSPPTFMATSTPPIGTPPGAVGWGRLLAAFDVTPKVTDTTSIGTRLSNVGTIESITRLDGRDFSAPPALAAASA